MNVLIPYTQRHPDTEFGAPDHATWVYVGDDDEAYWRTLCDWWDRGEAFLIVEHDVVCRPDVVEAVEHCPEPWCAFKYDDICHPECMEAWANTLGCTRFSAQIIAAVPHAVSAAAERDWHNLCDGIGTNLRAAGFTHHWHGPPVVHHHMGRNTVNGVRAFAPVWRDVRRRVTCAGCGFAGPQSRGRISTVRPSR